MNLDTKPLYAGTLSDLASTLLIGNRNSGASCKTPPGTELLEYRLGFALQARRAPLIERNVDRKPWLLEISCEEAGSMKPMFPDLLVVRQDAEGYLFDILEPHDPSLKDNATKAVGWVKFAEQHWALFDRIQLIRKKKEADGVERCFRLDVGNDAVRKKVLAVTTNSQRDQVIDDKAVVR